MSSPITASDFSEISSSGDICAKLKALLATNEKLATLLGFLFDDDGNAAQFLQAVSLPPPGVVVPYYTPNTDFASVKLLVQNLSRTTEDIDEGNSPFWQICDGENGTPDLRGRFILSAGAGSGLTERLATQTGGEEDHTLTEAELAAHTHSTTSLFLRYNDVSGDQNNPGAGVQCDFVAVTPAETGEDEPHNNMPPYYTLYYIMRTSRTA